MQRVLERGRQRWSAATPTSKGLLRALEPLAPPPGPWLIVGTGGGARAAAIAAARCGAAVAISSRSAERAAAFERWCGDRGLRTAPAAACTVVINATPLGLRADDPLPLEPDAVPRAGVAFDMVYRTGETPWVRAMRASGRRAADGREACWWRREPGPSGAGFRASTLPSRSCGAVVDAALR